MKQCSLCSLEKLEDDFYIYSIHKLSRGGIQKGYVCKRCSDMNYGNKWYPIIGYDENCEISNKGFVRELRENRYFNITNVQNGNTSYVYLTKNGEKVIRNIGPLTRKFCTEK